MSLYRIWEIRCEGPGDGAECPESEARTNDLSVAEIRKGVATFEGWTYRDGVDRCEGCSWRADR